MQQSVVFQASPAELFEIYMDSKKHSAATGSPAKISRKVGGRFTAFDGMLRGKNLAILPQRMIVQAWRAAHWKKADPDSILILWFRKAPGGGCIDLVHAGVPPYDHRGVRAGRPKYYWKPWKAYLAQRRGKS
ncbi:MAG: SRPBCC domain-containing protein [Acidobacteria bacterium]|nr:SRPBCC domain-containing protein [Acidobacteriota bacterium]